MSTSANLGLTHLSENQAQAYVLVNEAIDAFDDLAGRMLAVATKSADYSWTKSDGVILSNHSAEVDYTLPAVAGANAPYEGQRFGVIDISAAGAGANPINILVPSGAKLDGVTDGTAQLYGDKAWATIIFVDAATGYRIIRCKHLLDSTDRYVSIAAWNEAYVPPQSVHITLPTASDHIPAYLPFRPTGPVSVDQAVFLFGNVLPSSDVTAARARVWFHESNASTPRARMFAGATQDIVLQGVGHVRDASSFFMSHPGSFSYAIAPQTLAARRFFDGGQLYYFGYHLEPTFSAGVGMELARVGMGMAPVMLAAGAQAWAYTPGDNPAIAQTFGGNGLQRLCWGFRYRRLLER